jgi:hypothetical protein
VLTFEEDDNEEKGAYPFGLMGLVGPEEEKVGGLSDGRTKQAREGERDWAAG